MSPGKWVGTLAAVGALFAVVVIVLSDGGSTTSTTGFVSATTGPTTAETVATAEGAQGDEEGADSGSDAASAPRLDGGWVRTQGPIPVGPDTSPYWILGTRLMFDESVPWLAPDATDGRAVGQMVEQTGEDYVVELGHPLDGVPFGVAQPEVCVGCFTFPQIGPLLNPLGDEVEFEGSWDCDFSGEYQIAADPTYEEASAGDVVGVLRFPLPGSEDAAAAVGTTFQNDCSYTASASGGGEVTTEVSGLHVPVAATPDGAVGFQIVDYDTLIVYAFQRIYIYKRQG